MFLNAAYDALGLPVYITDLETFEVLYINEEGKNLLGDCVGLKCYEALNGTADACGGCIRADKLKKDGACRTKARHLVRLNKYVDTYESVIRLPDGAMRRLCILVDVTAQERLRQDNEDREKARLEMQHVIDIQSGFIESAKSMMSAASLDGQLIFVNQTMAETFGYTQEEILHLGISDFHPPEVVRAVLEEQIPHALATGSWKGTSVARRKDGTLFPVRQIIFPIKGESGENVAIATIFDDITKVRELERMNRYQLAIMNSSTNYIGVSDLQGNTIYHSPGAYRMMGYDPDEGKELLIAQSHPDWYVERVEKEGIPTALEKGQWVGRGEVIDRYGRHIPIAQTIFPVFDEDQQIMGVATIIQDITEQLRQEKEIDAGRRMLRKIIDTVPSAIFWKDKDSRFLGANKRFASDAGVDDPDKLIGLSDFDIYPAEIAELYVSGDRQAFETGREFVHFEEPFEGADNMTHWVSTSKVLIRDENDEAYALLGMYDDITKVKQNQMKLEEAIKVAEEASRAKGDFLSRMSHEIRTPMNAIIGMTKIGQTTTDMEKIQYCLQKIDGASKHLLGLINDVLDMSKIEADKLELAEACFDFEKMLENIFAVVNVKAEEKEQSILVDIHEDVPTEIIGDEMRISQVITNLLSNAVKFTPQKGSVRLAVWCAGETDDGRLRLSVSVADNGIGLTDEQMAKLFRSFEQAEAGTARKYGGTGLGLAISKRIVEKMDGEIGVTSQIGKGSTFTFTIPVRKGHDMVRKTYDLAVYKDLRVLVVDDAGEILDYCRRLLGQFAIRCDLVDNGADAVALVAKGIDEHDPYQLLFVDYSMEDMDGIETTRRVKEIAGDSVKVIMFSQTEWGLIEEHARLAGVTKFIAKPLFQSPILDCINQLVFSADGLAATKSADCTGIFHGATMLLAEDIEINREIVTALLEKTGIEIHCAVNGEEAVRLFSENPQLYDIIAMDVQMPIMDGLTATRQIRRLGTQAAKEIPIIAMTANACAEDVEACKQAGMVDHIGKPIDVDILIAKLQAYLPSQRRG